MKKCLYVTMMVLMFCLNACSQNQAISFDKLPKIAQAFIVQYFNKADISLVKIDKEASGTEYEVFFSNGTELEFDKNGEFKKVDCKRQAVPESLVPAQVTHYVQANHPNSFITEWEKKRNGWKAELDNEIDLFFDKDYHFSGMDD